MAAEAGSKRDTLDSQLIRYWEREAARLDRLALGPAGGERVWQLAHGVDPRSVETDRVEKSIGHEETFLHDIADPTVLRSELRRLSDRVAARLRDGGLRARTIALKP